MSNQRGIHYYNTPLEEIEECKHNNVITSFYNRGVIVDTTRGTKDKLSIVRIYCINDEDDLTSNEANILINAISECLGMQKYNTFA